MSSCTRLLLLAALAVPVATSCDMLGGKKADKSSKNDRSRDEDDGAAKADKKKKMPPRSSGEGVTLPTPASGMASAVSSAIAAKAFPTSAEFDKAAEVTVKGSTALGCETRVVREWLRVSCRGKNDTGGTPVLVRVGRGAGPDVHTFANGGITSLVLPYVEGVDVTAIFSWTNKSHRLVVSWPRGAPKPTVLATFEGAASPLDGTTTQGHDAVAKRLCGCLNQVRPGSCSEPEGGNPYCDATYGSDCRALVECFMGEPGRMPTCPAGMQRYVMNSCVPVCGAGNKCPSGLTCDTSSKLCL